MAKQTIAGHQFHVVKHGLDAKEVEEYINELLRQYNDLSARATETEALQRLAESTVREAHRIAVETRERAEIEAAGMRAQAKRELDDARQETAWIQEELSRQKQEGIARLTERVQKDIRAIYQKVVDQLTTLGVEVQQIEKAWAETELRIEFVNDTAPGDNDAESVPEPAALTLPGPKASRAARRSALKHFEDA